MAWGERSCKYYYSKYKGKCKPTMLTCNPKCPYYKAVQGKRQDTTLHINHTLLEINTKLRNKVLRGK